MKFSTMFSLIAILGMPTMAGCQTDIVPGDDSHGGGTPGMNGPLKGSVWEGVGGNWDLRLKVTQHIQAGGMESVVGTLTSSRSECFKADDHVGVNISESAVELLGMSHGTLADSSHVTFKGDISETNMTGRLTVGVIQNGNSNAEESGAPSAKELCEVTNLPFVFTRKLGQ